MVVFSTCVWLFTLHQFILLGFTLSNEEFDGVVNVTIPVNVYMSESVPLRYGDYYKTYPFGNDNYREVQTHILETITYNTNEISQVQQEHHSNNFIPSLIKNQEKYKQDNSNFKHHKNNVKNEYNDNYTDQFYYRQNKEVQTKEKADEENNNLNRLKGRNNRLKKNPAPNFEFVKSELKTPRKKQVKKLITKLNNQIEILEAKYNRNSNFMTLTKFYAEIEKNLNVMKSFKVEKLTATQKTTLKQLEKRALALKEKLEPTISSFNKNIEDEDEEDPNSQIYTEKEKPHKESQLDIPSTTDKKLAEVKLKIENIQDEINSLEGILNGNANPATIIQVYVTIEKVMDQLKSLEDIPYNLQAKIRKIENRIHDLKKYIRDQITNKVTIPMAKEIDNLLLQLKRIKNSTFKTKIQIQINEIEEMLSKLKIDIYSLDPTELSQLESQWDFIMLKLKNLNRNYFQGRLKISFVSIFSLLGRVASSIFTLFSKILQ